MDDRPTPTDRPKLYRWLFDRGLKTADAAVALECSRQTVRNICQPFNDTRRVKPSDALLGRIVIWTKGEVTAVDFYPPSLRSGPTEQRSASA